MQFHKKASPRASSLNLYYLVFISLVHGTHAPRSLPICIIIFSHINNHLISFVLISRTLFSTSSFLFYLPFLFVLWLDGQTSYSSVRQRQWRHAALARIQCLTMTVARCTEGGAQSAVTTCGPSSSNAWQWLWPDARKVVPKAQPWPTMKVQKEWIVLVRIRKLFFWV